MKKRLQRWMFLSGILCVLSLTFYGCGKAEGTAGVPAADDQNTLELDERDKEETVSGQQGENGSSGSEDAPYESEQYDLSGNVIEISNNQFTITENETTEIDDGMVMVGPAPGEDGTDFRKVTILYDEKTRFYMRKIYDGGARYEDEEASAGDLSEDMLVEIRGSYQGEVFHAEEVQLVSVL